MDTRAIVGYARRVEELLSGKRYGLEFYQREYGWGRPQVHELVTDLTVRFGDQYEDGHDRGSVASYREYFLGPIITSDRDGTSYLIDGQQRLTTLTLLLIVLLHRIGDVSQRAAVQQLVYSERYGRRSLVIDVPEREPAVQALLDGDDVDLTDVSTSVCNLVARHRDLEDLLELTDEQLPLFTDWLLNKVVLMEIIAPDGDMAYDIFETMNDRGLRLTPTDMLKGYLLAHIADDERIAAADDFWRARIQRLGDLRSDGDADFFKAWLRAHHATTIRERSRGAASGDYDLVGTQFHKWVRDNASDVGLDRPDDFHVFVQNSFDRMSRHYETLVRASEHLTPTLPHVRYATAANVAPSILATVALAPVRTDDEDDVAQAKMELVARYLDLFVVRRMLNFRNYGYSPIYYGMFQLSKAIRGASIDQLVDLLRTEAEDDAEPLESRGPFRLHGRNAPQVRYLLARLTDELQHAVTGARVFDSLLDRGRSDPYEIEHIWANHIERHGDDFASDEEFQERRNQWGDLLLLPKSFNASYGDLPYEEKLPHYRGQNVLASSLHPDTYVRNPNLRRWLETTGVPLRPLEHFTSEELDERQTAYRAVVEHIWDASRLLVAP